MIAQHTVLKLRPCIVYCRRIYRTDCITCANVRFARAWRIHACRTHNCVRREIVNRWILNFYNPSSLADWLVEQEVMMIRCNLIIRGSPVSRRRPSSMLAKATVVKGAVKSAEAKNRKSLLFSLFRKLRKSNLVSNREMRLRHFN